MVPILVTGGTRIQVRQIGQGTALAWSPDDWFLSYRDYTSCGNTWCMGLQLLYPSAGGPSTVLTSQESSGAERQPNERSLTRRLWVRTAGAQPVRPYRPPNNCSAAISGAFAWSPPNGQFALIQGARNWDKLDLVSCKRQAHTGVYSRARLSSIHTTYTLAWAPDSTTFAFVVGATVMLRRRLRCTCTRCQLAEIAGAFDGALVCPPLPRPWRWPLARTAATCEIFRRGAADPVYHLSHVCIATVWLAAPPRCSHCRFHVFDLAPAAPLSSAPRSARAQADRARLCLPRGRAEEQTDRVLARVAPAACSTRGEEGTYFHDEASTRPGKGRPRHRGNCGVAAPPWKEIMVVRTFFAQLTRSASAAQAVILGKTTGCRSAC